MSLADQLKISKQENSTILYDASLITAPSLQLFDSDYHTNGDNQQNKSIPQASMAVSSASSSKTGIGRARVVYFDHENIKMVLKHYYRGGLVASVVKDRYIGFDVEKTRAIKEFRLLVKMHQLGLPVPNAIAACVEKGPFYFRADLITREIENANTMADILSAQKMVETLWVNIGACIRKFHDNNVYHADLNARNILLSKAGDVYLIDFDNSRFRVNSSSWKMANLARLKRSLLKFKKNVSDFNFDEENWSALYKGYNL